MFTPPTANYTHAPGLRRQIYGAICKCFKSTTLQVAYTIFPQISDRLKMAGYQYAVGTGKQIYATFYTNQVGTVYQLFYSLSYKLVSSS